MDVLCEVAKLDSKSGTGDPIAPSSIKMHLVMTMFPELLQVGKIVGVADIFVIV